MLKGCGLEAAQGQELRVSARLVPPLQGGEVGWGDDLGLGAVRLTPGFHSAGFQPADRRCWEDNGRPLDGRYAWD